MLITLPFRKLFGLFLVAGLLFSFKPADPFNAVVSSFQKGNMETLSSYLDDMVEVSLTGKRNSYSKSQALVVLKDFFKTHPVKGFKLIHKGKGGSSGYGIGQLQTSNGNYRVTFFFQNKSDTQLLRELRFQKSNSPN